MRQHHALCLLGLLACTALLSRGASSPPAPEMPAARPFTPAGPAMTQSAYEEWARQRALKSLSGTGVSLTSPLFFRLHDVRVRARAAEPPQGWRRLTAFPTMPFRVAEVEVRFTYMYKRPGLPEQENRAIEKWLRRCLQDDLAAGGRLRLTLVQPPPVEASRYH